MTIVIFSTKVELNMKFLAQIAVEILFLKKKDCSGKLEIAPKKIFHILKEQFDNVIPNCCCQKTQNYTESDGEIRQFGVKSKLFGNNAGSHNGRHC